MMKAALSDERGVTGLEEAGWHSGTKFTVSRIADEEGFLALQLGHAKCREAVPFLLELVRKNPRSGPIEALGEIGDARAVPALIVIVKNNGKDARYAGSMLLPDVFRVAVGALAKLKASDSLPVLLEHHEYPEVIEALEQIGDRRAVPALGGMIGDKGRVVRNGSERHPELVPERLAAARIAIASLEEGDPIPRWCALLKDPSFDAFQRRQVVWRLGEKPDPEAVPFLIQAIKSDPAACVVLASIRTLEGFRYKSAVDGLIECYDADFSEMRFVPDLPGNRFGKVPGGPEQFRDDIADALKKLTGQKFGPDKRQWLEWWQTGKVRHEALE